MALPTPAWTYHPSVSLLRGVFILLLAGMIVVTTALSTTSDYEGRPRYSKQEIRRAVAFFAKRYHLDPALLRAVIKVESDFRHDVVSRKGAIGLMQLTPDTAATLRVADVHDPIQNIRGGARQLRHLLNLYHGDLPIALAAYNAGVHRIKGHRVPRIRETQSYVRKVLRYYKAFRTPKKAGQSINVPPRFSQAPAPFTRLRRKPRLLGCGAMRAGVLRSLGEGGHASTGSAEGTRGTTAVKPWGSTSQTGSKK